MSVLAEKWGGKVEKGAMELHKKCLKIEIQLFLKAPLYCPHHADVGSTMAFSFSSLYPFSLRNGKKCVDNLLILCHFLMIKKTHG